MHKAPKGAYDPLSVGEAVDIATLRCGFEPRRRRFLEQRKARQGTAKQGKAPSGNKVTTAVVSIPPRCNGVDIPPPCNSPSLQRGGCSPSAAAVVGVPPRRAAWQCKARRLPRFRIIPRPRSCAGGESCLEPLRADDCSWVKSRAITAHDGLQRIASSPAKGGPARSERNSRLPRQI